MVVIFDIGDQGMIRISSDTGKLQPKDMLKFTESNDACIQARSLSDWDQEFYQLSSGIFKGITKEIHLGNIQIFQEVMNQIVYQRANCQKDSITIAIPSEISGEGNWNGKLLNKNNTLLYLRPNFEHIFKTPKFSNIYGITLNIEVLNRYIEDSDMHLSTNIKELNILDNSFYLEFSNKIIGIFNFIEDKSIYTECFNLYKHLESEIYDLLFSAFNNIPKIRSKYPSQYVSRYLVDCTKEYIYFNKSRNLNVSDICNELRVSRRSLHYSFNKVLGISPVVFLRYIRLNGAKQEIINTNGIILINDIAQNWGFWHMGMFSNYYKQLFGELPSQTVKRYSIK